MPRGPGFRVRARARPGMTAKMALWSNREPQHDPWLAFCDHRGAMSLGAATAVAQTVGPRLAHQADQGLHPVRRRQRDRCRPPRGVRSPRHGTGAAHRDRESRRRRRHSGCRRRGAGRARRLHHPRQFLGPHHRALDRAQHSLRHRQGPRRRADDRPERQCPDRLARQGLEDRPGPRRLRQGQARHHQLRLGRRRHRDPYERGAVPAQRRHRGRAHSLQGRRRGPDRRAGRPHRLLFLSDLDRAAAHSRRPGAGAGR